MRASGQQTGEEDGEKSQGFGWNHLLEFHSTANVWTNPFKRQAEEDRPLRLNSLSLSIGASMINPELGRAPGSRRCYGDFTRNRRGDAMAELVSRNSNSPLEAVV